MRDKEEPTQKILYLESITANAYWLKREAFKIIDGVLYIIGEDEDKKLVIPTSLKEQALRMNHDIPLAAHQGIDRTKARVKEKFYWHSLQQM